MEYLPGMEQIDSNVCSDVRDRFRLMIMKNIRQKDVRAALEHATCTVEDFKALLSPAAEPFLEQMAERGEIRDRETFWQHGISVYPFII